MCLKTHERRRTLEDSQNCPARREVRKWPISSLLLLNVPFRHTFVVVSRNRLIFELLKLMIVRILYS